MRATELTFLVKGNRCPILRNVFVEYNVYCEEAN